MHHTDNDMLQWMIKFIPLKTIEDIPLIDMLKHKSWGQKRWESKDVTMSLLHLALKSPLPSRNNNGQTLSKENSFT